MLRCSHSLAFCHKHASTYSKPILTAAEAVKDIKSGNTLVIGGFGTGGSCHALCTALANRSKEVNNLKLYTNAGSIGDEKRGVAPYGIGQLFHERMVSFVACSHFGSNSYAERQYFEGLLSIEFTPQGSLAERMRAGSSGCPAFYTATSAHTILQQGGNAMQYCPHKDTVCEYSEPKETRIFDGKLHVLEKSIRGDFSLIKAAKADKYGNCTFRGTSRNFNVPGAGAADCCIVEVAEIVDHIPPDEIHLPGVYIDRIVPAKYECYIENKTWLPPPKPQEVVNKNTIPKTHQEKLERLSKMTDKEKTQRRAALEIKPDTFVNLGIGTPTHIPNYCPKDLLRTVMFQTENGMLGMGSFPKGESNMDSDYINAGKETVTAVPGASTFSSDESFAMIRGGRLDLTILGAFEVDETAALASWLIPGVISAGPGGSQDLIVGIKHIVCTMPHTNKYGQPKLLRTCRLPLTAKEAVHRVITDKAVFDFEDKRLVLKELTPGVSLEDVRATTEARFTVSPDLKEMEYSWY